MAAPVTVDVAGGPAGGAARFRTEFYQYLRRTGRMDVRVIGAQRRVGPAWLLRREVTGPPKARRVALNNVGFIAPGGERVTLLRNALHFLTDEEESGFDPKVITAVGRERTVVRAAARRSDVLVAPCTSMAERVARVTPGLQGRLVVRPHPVSADSIPRLPRDPAILCPVLFTPYKQMTQRLTELLAAIDDCIDPSVRILVTAERAEVPERLARRPRIRLVGRLGHAELRALCARSSVIYYPTGLESFGYPLAEARVSGHPIVALDTAQNREIAGPALCGFELGDEASLRNAITLALTAKIAPDPAPFDPDAYFNWLLGPAR
jgi:glycosyltransferase involved in cell wall biosynthesis